MPPQHVGQLSVLQKAQNLLSSFRNPSRDFQLPDQREVVAAVRSFFKQKQIEDLDELIEQVEKHRAYDGISRAILYETRIVGSLQNNDLSGVLKAFSRDARRLDKGPTLNMCHAVISCTGKAGRGLDARKFVGKMQQEWQLPVSGATVMLLMEALLDAGDEVGALDVEEEYGYDQFPRSPRAFRVVVRAQGSAFSAKEAINAAMAMLQDGWTLEASGAEQLLEICSAESDVEGCEGVWARMKLASIEPTERACSAYACALAEAGRPIDEIFEAILGAESAEDHPLSQSVASGIARSLIAAGRLKRADALLWPLLKTRPSSDIVAAAITLRGRQGMFDEAKKLYNSRRSLQTRHSFIDAVARSEECERGVIVAEEAPRNSLQTLGVLMRSAGCMDDGLERRIWKLFSRAPYSGHCTMGLRGLFLGHAHLGNVDRAADAARRMIIDTVAVPSQRLISAAVSASPSPLALIDSLMDAGIPITARPFSDLMKNEPSPRGVRELVSQLQRRGIDKDEGTYVRLAEIELQKGRVDGAMEVLDEVERQPLQEPEPYVAVMEYLASQGSVEECWNVFVRMVKADTQPNPSVYRALATSIVVDGSLSGEQAIEHILASAEHEGVSVNPEFLHGELEDLYRREQEADRIPLTIEQERERTAREEKMELRDISPNMKDLQQKRSYSNPNVVVLDQRSMMGLKATDFGERLERQETQRRKRP